MWGKIPPENLQHVSLFDYELIKEGEKYNVYNTPIGVVIVDKKNPRIYFKDISDAIQLGAKGILVPR